jgi:hypothetical protein
MNVPNGGPPPNVPAPPGTVRYSPDEKMQKRLENDFVYHSPKGDQAERYGYLRLHAKHLAHDIVSLTPPSREQSVALTKLEEAIFFANAAIARNE